MMKSIPPALLGLMTAFALGAVACGSTEAKPAAPVVYPAAPIASPYGHGVEAPSQPSVSISGEGRASAPPDVARIQVTITASAPTAAEARSEGSAAISQLLDALKDGGVASEDVETRSFSISPITQRDEDSGESRLIEYQLRNVSVATLRDVARIGELLDTLGADVGDTLRIDNITLAIEDPTDIRSRAREKAMLDARAKAQQLADLAGAELGGPLSISESFEGAPSGQLAKEVLVGPAEAGLAPVSVGELEAAVSVYAVYALIAE